ncbi:MAG: hypothetical protein P8M73_00400 [Luminiphilus sp.]|nr:hypothetical protein [Luminiphilus sp.]
MSILLPFLAAIVLLCTIAMCLAFYGEYASHIKRSILVSACLVIGFSSGIAQQRLRPLIENIT